MTEINIIGRVTLNLWRVMKSEAGSSPSFLSSGCGDFSLLFLFLKKNIYCHQKCFDRLLLFSSVSGIILKRQSPCHLHSNLNPLDLLLGIVLDQHKLVHNCKVEEKMYLEFFFLFFVK